MPTATRKKEDQVSNAAASLIMQNAPYRVMVTLQGVTPLLFHAWSSEVVAEKSKALKNSVARKTDNLESMVYRDTSGHLGIAGYVLQGAIVDRARDLQDPRSPRKSARDLVKSVVQVLTPVAVFEPRTKDWDFEDRRRVVIQRAAITRTRPAMKEGWRASFEISVLAPEYIPEVLLQDLLQKAGVFSGLCDFRPTYGRFNVIQFSRL